MPGVKSKRVPLACILALASLVLWYLGKPAASPQFGEDAKTLTRQILELGPRPPGSDALNQARSLVIRELEAAGWSAELQEFERTTSIGNVSFANVRARFKTGNGNPWNRKARGLLCAHIDSKLYKDRIFVGADDAASACAAMVVMARHLAAHQPELAAKLELVFFDGEEAFAEHITALDGLYGSRHYANTWRTRDDKPDFGIVLDMIGHRDLSIRIPADSPTQLADLMFDVATEQKVSSRFGKAPGNIIDDHVPLNLVGIPTLDIIGDFSRSRWWHSSGDNIDLISPESLQISIRLTLGMLERLLEHS